MSEFFDELPVTAAAANRESVTAIPILLLGLVVASTAGAVRRSERSH